MTPTRFPDPRAEQVAGLVPLPGGWGWSVHDRRTALRLLGDPRLGVVEPGAAVAALRATLPPAEQRLLDDVGAFAGRIMLQTPPARHSRLRRAFGRWFDAAAVDRLAPGMRECAHGLLAPFAAAGGGEFMTAIAFPYAVSTGARLLGTSPAAFARLHRLSQRVALVAYASRVPDAAQAVRDGHAALQEAWDLLAEAERTAPEGSVLAVGPAAPGAATGGDGGTGLTGEEFRANAVMLVQASVETVAGMIGSAASRLLRSPGALTDAGARASAVEDVLREEPPLKTLERVALEPVEVDGVVVRAGQVVSVRVAEANGTAGTVAGDAVFSFGWGAYRCLGARMARRQAAELFAELARLAPGASIGEPAVERVRHLRFDMPRRLPVVIAPARGSGAFASALTEALAEHDLDRPLTSLEQEIAVVVAREHGLADPDHRLETIREWVAWATSRG